MLTEIKSFLIEYFSRFGSNQSEVEGNFRNKHILIYLLSDRYMSGEPDKLIVSLKKMDSSDSIWNDRVKDKTTHIEITQQGPIVIEDIFTNLTIEARRSS